MFVCPDWLADSYYCLVREKGNKSVYSMKDLQNLILMFGKVKSRSHKQITLYIANHGFRQPRSIKDEGELLPERVTYKRDSLRIAARRDD